MNTPTIPRVPAQSGVEHISITCARRIEIGRQVFNLVNDLILVRPTMREDLWHELIGQQVLSVIKGTP